MTNILPDARTDRICRPDRRIAAAGHRMKMSALGAVGIAADGIAEAASGGTAVEQ